MAISSRLFRLCLSESNENAPSSSRLSRRVVLSADVLKSSKILAGDAIALFPDGSRASKAMTFAIGVAWPSNDVTSDDVLVSRSHLLNCGANEGEKCRIFPLSNQKNPTSIPSLKSLKEARLVRVRNDGYELPKGGRQLNWLSLYIRETFVDQKYVYPGQRVQLTFEGRDRQFTVIQIASQDDPEGAIDLDSISISSSPQLWTAGWDTQVTLHQPSPSKRASKVIADNVSGSPIMEGYSSVGGLDAQISQVRDLIEIPLTRPDLFRRFGLKPPKGILLYGPPGTGKTHLARAIVASTRSSVLVVNGSELSSVYHGETEARLRDVFADARRRSPCIVVLDEVDALCPRREDGSGGEVERRVVATLLTILDGMGEKRNDEDDEEKVIVIATTNRPNAIDPALRRPGRFDREIEIGIPDANARFAILKVLLAKSPNNITEDELKAFASRTHGYVGADLSAVVREAGTLAIKRWLHSSSSPQIAHANPLEVHIGDPLSAQLTLADINSSLANVQPSAMREVFLETPQVRWADIGGQTVVKQKLRECVEWPLVHPEAFARLGVHAPKGVLLYGPPGCSKTLTARALATESGLNFIAVKGPELINKFVGESERAVRELFRKARAAAPSIVFFDELDALGTSRGATDSGNRHEGVLTTLLNEMDGIQELVGVTVVAATNRPDVIDTALMRPGRLDRILYVGPPDHQGRMDILRLRAAKMAVDPDIDLTEIAAMTEGCSGAEIVALCQDAALLTMRRDINAPFVPHAAFVEAARSVRKQITPETIALFETWSKESGLTTA